MSGKHEPPGPETTPQSGASDPHAPSLDAIRAKLGALRKSLDAKPDDATAKPAPPPLPPALPPASAPPPAPAAAPVQTQPESPARDTGETRDAAKTDPVFEVPFTLLRPKASEPAAPSTDPGRSLGTAPAPPPPPPFADESASVDSGPSTRASRRPWIISLAAMIPVTGFLCFLAYYVGNARLRGDRINDAKETIQAARTAVEAAHAEFQTLSVRVKRTQSASVDPRSKRWIKIEWAEWEAIRAALRPAALSDVLGVKRVDRLGAVAVKLLFDYHTKVTDFFRVANSSAAIMLTRRADFEKALADPEGSLATTTPHRYAVVTRAPAGDVALSVGEVVVVRRILGRAGAAGGNEGAPRVEVVKLSGSLDEPLVVGEDDLVNLVRSDVIRRGHELLREFAEQVKRLERMAADAEEDRRLLVVELDRLSR